MVNETKCPQCKGGRTISGRYLSQTDSFGIGQVFRPDGLKFFSMLGTDLSMSKRFRVCLDCGLFWQHINPSQLMKIITKRGKLRIKVALGLQ